MRVYGGGRCHPRAGDAEYSDAGGVVYFVITQNLKFLYRKEEELSHGAEKFAQAIALFLFYTGSQMQFALGTVLPWGDACNISEKCRELRRITVAYHVSDFFYREV